MVGKKDLKRLNDHHEAEVCLPDKMYDGICDLKANAHIFNAILCYQNAFFLITSKNSRRLNGCWNWPVLILSVISFKMGGLYQDVLPLFREFEFYH